jgi:excisionase family DNA binding protein
MDFSKDEQANLQEFLEKLNDKLDKLNELLEKKFYQNNPSPEQYLLSVDEAYEYLGISRSSLYHLIRSGSITFRRIGGRKKFNVKDLDNYLQGKETKELPSII